MLRSYLKSALYAATALSAIAPVAAFAQDESGGVEQIVVTARRIQERLQDVPMSISVFNQAQLTDRNIVNASDLAAYTPSLTVNEQFGADASSFVIRGFLQDIGTSPTVGTYFADVVSQRGGFGGATIHAGEGAGPGAFFDLENVQVLKGPQGTLFGRNTTGGAVLLVPQKPTDEYGGYIEASAGDYGMERFQAVLNIPITDHFRIRIGADQETRDGYIKNLSGIGPGTMNNINYGTVRISADWDVTSNIDNYTIVSYTDSDNHGSDTEIVGCNPAQALGYYGCAQLNGTTAYGAVPGYSYKYPVQGPYTVDNALVNPRSLIQEGQIINTTTWSLGDNLTFKNIASWGEVLVINHSSLFGDDFQLFPGPPFELSGEDSPPGIPLSRQNSVSEEPRFAGTAFDGKMQWQAGLYFEMSYPDGLSGSSGPNQIACSDFQTLQCPPFGFAANVGRRIGTITYRDYAVYAQDTYSITDKLLLTTGIRFTADETEDNVFRYSYFFLPPYGSAPVRYCETGLPGSYPGSGVPGTGNCDVAQHQDSSAPTGLINLEYKLTDDVNTYIQYARGYRQGSILGTGPIGFSTFQPEHLNAYEVGVKSTLEGPIPGFVNAAFFYNDFIDQQLLGTFVDANNPNVPLNAGILNVGASRIFGLDFDSTLLLTPDLTLNLGYTYLNSLLEKANIPTLPAGSLYTTFGTNEVQGSPLAFTPTSKISITGTYRLPFDQSIGKVSLGVTYVYTDPQIVYGDGPFSHLPQSNVFNLNANWESIFGKPVDAEFFMTNVTNLHYPTYVDNFMSPSPQFEQAGFASESFAPPRMYGFRLRYHF